MHESRLLMLRRQSLSEPRSSAELLVKLRAMRDLLEQDGRVPVDVFRAALVDAVENPRFSNWEGQRASILAGRLLDLLDEMTEEPEPVPTEPNLFFAEDLLFDMARALDLRVEAPEWRTGSSRLDRLGSAADLILASDDQPQALAVWMEQNRVVATVPAGGEIFVTGDDLFEPPNYDAA